MAAPTCTKERSRALLARSRRLGDVVKPNPLRRGEFVVTSSDDPNRWYRVRPGVGCGCTGFARFGICRHYVRLAWEYRYGNLAEGGRMVHA